MVNLLASSIKSSTYDEIVDLAHSIAVECGDPEYGDGIKSEGTLPTTNDVAKAISNWANFKLAKEEN